MTTDTDWIVPGTEVVVYRPRIGSDPGWPRPRAAVTSRFSDEQGSFPVPWITQQHSDGFDPLAFDSRRSGQMYDLNLCQVCGRPRGDTVYALAGQDDLRDRQEWAGMPQAGGAVCSLRCARLTAAVCPHYRRQQPVNIYRAPHPGPRADLGGGANDDLIDITDSRVSVIDVVGAKPTRTNRLAAIAALEAVEDE